MELLFFGFGLLVFVGVWIVSAVFTGVVAYHKWRNAFRWALLAFFFSPLVLILVAALPRAAKVVPAEPETTCPKCAEPIRAAAKVCRSCGHSFPDEPPSAAGPKPIRHPFSPRDGCSREGVSETNADAAMVARCGTDQYRSQCERA